MHELRKLKKPITDCYMDVFFNTWNNHGRVFRRLEHEEAVYVSVFFMPENKHGRVFPNIGHF